MAFFLATAASPLALLFSSAHTDLQHQTFLFKLLPHPSSIGIRLGLESGCSSIVG
jgi:hypothetical protein